jgi:opacity protein-like surface antigen
MNVRTKGMLASSAVAALMVASAGLAQADGMPGGHAAYERPALWTGAYAGIQAGWDHERYKEESLKTGLGSDADRDVVAGGVFLGYQQQFGALVVGGELNLIGTENDRPSSTACPNSTATNSLDCTGRIENLIMVGAKVGWALGNWMPYATGGYASGGVHFRVQQNTPITTATPTGTFISEASERQDGWYAGGGVDWRLSRHAVVSIDYKHIDLGSDHTFAFNTAGGGGTIGGITDKIRQNAEADQVMLRASLLFGPGYEAAPLK